MENGFLIIDKDYFGTGLKPIEILVLAQIKEYDRNNSECYMTNKQLADMFGVTEKTIARTISKLEQDGIIERSTSTQGNNGKASKIRTLHVIEGRDKMSFASDKVGTNCPEGKDILSEGRDNLSIRKGQNVPIKYNIKENKKEKKKKSACSAATESGTGLETHQDEESNSSNETHQVSDATASMILSYWHGHTYDEIASYVGCSYNDVVYVTRKFNNDESYKNRILEFEERQRNSIKQNKQIEELERMGLFSNMI